MRKLDTSMVRAITKVVSKYVLYSSLGYVVIYFIETIILTGILYEVCMTENRGAVESAEFHSEELLVNIPPSLYTSESFSLLQKDNQCQPI